MKLKKLLAKYKNIEFENIDDLYKDIILVVINFDEE